MSEPEKNGNGDGKGEKTEIQTREAIPWMPEGWWTPRQWLDRTGRQITVWWTEKEGKEIYVGHGVRAERFPEGTAVQPMEFVIEASSFDEAKEKYDACLAEAGERVGEEMRKNYTRAKLMAPPAGDPTHSGTFRRLNQRPRF